MKEVIILLIFAVNKLHLRDEKTGEILFCHLRRIEEGEMPVRNKVLNNS